MKNMYYNKSKYGNKKTEINGIKFDSALEAERYKFLMLMLDAGQIEDLRLQHNFTLVEGFKEPTGERVSGEVYRADFTYKKDGKLIVEDVKGVKTEVYKSKKKRVRDKYGITIREITRSNINEL